MPADWTRRLDFSKIAFPTDSVSIGRIRRIEPDVVDEDDVRVEDSTLRAAISHEVAVAVEAFRTAQGHSPTTDGLEQRGHNLEVLNEVYVLYGLSAGMHQTDQLLREIESQAAAQARSRGGRS